MGDSDAMQLVLNNFLSKVMYGISTTIQMLPYQTTNVWVIVISKWTRAGHIFEHKVLYIASKSLFVMNDVGSNIYYV